MADGGLVPLTRQKAQRARHVCGRPPLAITNRLPAADQLPFASDQISQASSSLIAPIACHVARARATRVLPQVRKTMSKPFGVTFSA